MFFLKKVKPSDKDLIFKWRNDPFIVALSEGQQTVDYETHSNWFDDSLESPDRALYKVEIEPGRPGGLLRFDRESDRCWVSIYLLREHTGKGIGTEVLQQSSLVALENWPEISGLDARIRKENKASISSFSKAGFVIDAIQSRDDMVVMKRSVEARDVSELEKNEDISRYGKLLSQHGSTVRSLGWSSVETQELRFSVLNEIIKSKDAWILDVGCGLGDLYGFCQNRGFEGSYTGIDITENMVLEARKKFSSANFLVGDILTDDRLEEGQFDYVFASGIFTFRQKGGLDFVRKMAEKMYSMADQACAFNLLSTWRTVPVEGDEFVADPVEILKLVREISPWVSLRHDYHLGDFTAIIYKKPIEERA